MAEADLIEQAKALLLEAAYDGAAWPGALDVVARACGARSGQLISLNGDGAVDTHWLTEMPEDFTRQIEAFGLANPVVNPRLRIGLRAAPMIAVADQDHVDPDTRARHPIYTEMFDPYDVPFNCQAVVLRNSDRLVRVSISRTARQGPLDAAAFRAFSTLTPHVHAAVRFQARLGAARIHSILETLDAMDAVGFLLDGSNRVIGMSAEGERRVVSGEIVRIEGGRLRAALPEDQTTLDHLVAAATTGEDAMPNGGGWLRNQGGGPGLSFSAHRLPASGSILGGQGAVLVVARPASTNHDRMKALRLVYRLSEGEAAVAIMLANGEPLDRIADRRAVSRATVRSQVQAVYAKMNIHRQAELVAAVRDLG